MAFVRTAFFPCGTRKHYDALSRAVGELPRPVGRILFAAGPVPGGWQVVQVWRSRTLLDSFNAEVFFPALRSIGSEGFPQPPTVVDFDSADLDVNPSGT